MSLIKKSRTNERTQVFERKIDKLEIRSEKKTELEENFNQEIDELSQETKNLALEIEKWQT